MWTKKIPFCCLVTLSPTQRLKSGTVLDIVDKPAIYSIRWGRLGLEYILVADENLSFHINNSVLKVT
jgi:hypothetical protein